jgi:hypothetical protein
MEQDLTFSKDLIIVIDPSLTSDRAIKEGICTFVYTKRRYSSQPWYICQQCNIYCCIICKNNCHNGHDMSPESNSDFFCDCGADNLNCASMKKLD